MGIEKVSETVLKCLLGNFRRPVLICHAKLSEMPMATASFFGLMSDKESVMADKIANAYDKVNSNSWLYII